jgi:hypothetical protein
VFPPCSPRKIQKEASDQRSSDSKRFKVAKRSKAVDDEEYSVMRNVYCVEFRLEYIRKDSEYVF